MQYKPGDSIEGKYSVHKVFGGENQSGRGTLYFFGFAKWDAFGGLI